MANILVAEDERDIRELINFMLTFAGHQITLAENGEEAVEKAQEILPDLIMMDVRMPKLTGYEACRKIKEIESTKEIPVVFLTAKGQDEEVTAGIEVGAVAYILKPFELDKLTEQINEILMKIGHGR